MSIEANIEELSQGIVAISLDEETLPVIFMMPVNRAPKRKLENDLIDIDRKFKNTKFS